MKEERMKILQMVEDGKITIEEAGKLLSAMKAGSYCDEESFSDKFEEFCENSENAIGGFVKTAVAKTAELIDDLGKSLGSFLKGFAEKTEEDDEDCDCGCCDDDEDRKN